MKEQVSNNVNAIQNFFFGEENPTNRSLRKLNWIAQEKELNT